jgi:hypothetical protein
LGEFRAVNRYRLGRFNGIGTGIDGAVCNPLAKMFDGSIRQFSLRWHLPVLILERLQQGAFFWLGWYNGWAGIAAAPQGCRRINAQVGLKRFGFGRMTGIALFD